MIDLTSPSDRERVQTAIKEELNAVSAARRPNRRSVRLSPSMLGDDCVAKTWFNWRWVMKPSENVDGRMARYNEAGEEKEAVVVQLLRDAGWTVEEADENGNQFAVTDLQGHLYGRMDGRAMHPVHTGGQKFLFENKYVNTKRFTTLASKPLIQADPKYYAQICLYMKIDNLPATLFISGNRNDADINPVIIPRDDQYAIAELRKAEAIAASQSRPARVAESAAFFRCKMCEMVSVCHHAAPVDINCRSCINAVPIDGGKWFCNRWQTTIPNREAIEAACSEHSPIC